MRTLKELTASLLALLPPGLVSRMGPDRRKIWEAIADTLRTEISDRIDRLDAENNPAQVVQFLALWEEALDLSGTKVARFGSISRRQAQVVAALRSMGGDLSIPALRALLAPFFDYADPAQIEVLEPDRAALKAAHTYLAKTTLPAVIPTGFPPLVVFFEILDDGPVSDAGAQIFINVTGDLSQMTFTLLGPGGTSQQVFWDVGELGDGAVTNANFVLYAPPTKQLNGASIRGQAKGMWSLICVVRSGVAALNSAAMFIEAVGRNSLGQECLGNELHSFVVVADPALLGPNADLDAAEGALLRQKPGYTGAAIVVKNIVMGGGVLAIPDLPTTIPDASIPG